MNIIGYEKNLDAILLFYIWLHVHAKPCFKISHKKCIQLCINKLILSYWYMILGTCEIIAITRIAKDLNHVTCWRNSKSLDDDIMYDEKTRNCFKESMNFKFYIELRNRKWKIRMAIKIKTTISKFKNVARIHIVEK